MGVFDNLIRINEHGEMVYDQWIEWDHFLIPNMPEQIREICGLIMFFLGHCKTCTALDGCYFLEHNCPLQPQHHRCDCGKINLEFNYVEKKIKAYCPLAKLTNYILKGYDESKGKKSLFESWGYTEDNAEEIKNSLEEQAREKYLMGKYILKGLDKHGQRLAIPVNLRGHVFYSGWILRPEGYLVNTTPFGGWLL